MCTAILENESTKIGGEGKTVEIDESKFGKRKFHKGRRVDGVWVFGGIERETKLCFFQTVENRTADTLVSIIKDNILPGTTIISDCWKAYDSLSKEGFNHLKVNHSVNFVDPDSGSHTNTIESTWRALKKSLPVSGTVKSLYDTYFSQYCIRKKYLIDSPDPFLKFLELVSQIYDPSSTWSKVAQVDPSPDSRPQPVAKRTRIVFQDITNQNDSLDDFQL